MCESKGLPDKLPDSNLVILFLDKINRTSLVIFANAPGWISEMRLLDMFTERSLGCVARTRGLSLSREKTLLCMWFKCDTGTLFVVIFRTNLGNCTKVTDACWCRKNAVNIAFQPFFASKSASPAWTGIFSRRSENSLNKAISITFLNIYWSFMNMQSRLQNYSESNWQKKYWMGAVLEFHFSTMHHFPFLCVNMYWKIWFKRDKFPQA